MMRAAVGKEPANGSWTQAALEAKACLQKDHWEQLRRLRDRARQKDLKADAALRQAPEELKEGINRGQLIRALKGEIKHIDPSSYHT